MIKKKNASLIMMKKGQHLWFKTCEHHACCHSSPNQLIWLK